MKKYSELPHPLKQEGKSKKELMPQLKCIILILCCYPFLLILEEAFNFHGAEQVSALYGFAYNRTLQTMAIQFVLSSRFLEVKAQRREENPGHGSNKQRKRVGGER